MLNIKDLEYLRSLVESDLGRLNDRRNDPKTSPNDLCHTSARAVSGLLSRVNAAIRAASKVEPS